MRRNNKTPLWLALVTVFAWPFVGLFITLDPYWEKNPGKLDRVVANYVITAFPPEVMTLVVFAMSLEQHKWLPVGICILIHCILGVVLFSLTLRRSFRYSVVLRTRGIHTQ